MRALYAVAATLITVAVAAPAQAQGERNGATGATVISVAFPGGEFRRQSDGSWNEYGSDGRVTFRFRETGRDEWSVYLSETGSDKRVQIDLHRMKIGISQGGAPMSDLYDITSAQAPRVTVQARVPATMRVGRVDFRDGYFMPTGGDGRWAEYRRDGSVAYRFVLRHSDSETITLFDESRGTAVQFNLPRQMILISFSGAPFEDLYPITGTTTARPASVPPPSELRPVNLPGASYIGQSNFKIEAGPITSQAEANAKCSALAARVRGQWTQGWERRDGVNSVCVIAFPR